ncbi:MAG: DNA/RNA non-specific endonuclease [Acidovorax sp.]
MTKSKRPTPRFRFTPLPELEAKRVRLTPDPLESYEDREGYRADFIGPDYVVPLPKLSTAAKKDAAMHTWKGAKTHVLDYTHFSTAVSKSRRMPIFSACNIDGSKAKVVTRGDVWKFDPRISQEYQILKEVYGNEKDGYFSRGHMTRRQDPDWGSKAIAELADADTFHATNAAPQVQRFNAGLWGGIEDYILANTKRDSMRVSVFTGPVFAGSDPVIHGVKVPVRFWKVVAFLHDETEQLTATGYLASQAKAIADLKPAFVFGDFENQQRPLAAIEALAGLSFGELTQLDVLAGAGPSFAASLKDVRDIMLA